ncbi:MAG: bacillithiol system redox-active protein YtxJ [Thermonemataceae bacterium]
MNWTHLTTEAALTEAIAVSQESDIIIFKHSTRCAISGAALARLERAWQDNTPVKPFFLDLIQYRDLSNKVAATFKVVHESPQVLFIRKGVCIYDASHIAISYEDIKAQVLVA